MPGVRIQHPSARSTTFTIVDASRPYRTPWACPPPPIGCARTHGFKTYHIRLDEVGSAIVAPEILDRLRRIPGQPFRVTNDVAEPPAQTVRVPLLLVRTRPLAPRS